MTTTADLQLGDVTEDGTVTAITPCSEGCAKPCTVVQTTSDYSPTGYINWHSPPTYTDWTLIT